MKSNGELVVTFDPVGAASYLEGWFKDPPGLCCESIGLRNGADFEHTYWLMNDNALAVVALDRLGKTALRDKIKAKLAQFQPLGHDCFRNLGWVDPFLHQKLMHLEPVKTQNCYLWNEVTEKFEPGVPCDPGVGGIVHEEHNGDQYGDEEYYFDLSASKALSWHKQFQTSGKISDRWVRDFFITRMEQMWDPSNLGFVGRGFNGRMTTYYLAAYILVGEKTGWPNPFYTNRRNIVLNTFNSLQLPNGGFGTSYTTKNGKLANIEAYGNVETTSLAICANIRPQDYYTS